MRRSLIAGNRGTDGHKGDWDMMHRVVRGLLTSASSAAVTLLAVSQAHAQAQERSNTHSAAATSQDDQPAEAGQTDRPKLEDIVVTGERANRYGADTVQAGSFRGARAIDTPLTVSVIPREVIDVQQAKTLQDVLQNTAGVTASQTAPTVYSNLAIRGINVENRGNYRLNGSLPIINLVSLPLEDKDRVEALKGASALYYGFTTPSGIINLTMKRPTKDLLLAMDVSGDTNGTIGGHVDFGGTWGIFGARINGVIERPDSGIDHTRGRRSLISGAFDLKPADNLTITFDAEHIYKRVNEPGIYRFILKPASTAANPYPSLNVPSLIDPSTNFGPDWAFNRAEETNLLGAVNWRISPAWALTLSGGTSTLNRDRHFTTIDPNNPNTAVPNGPIGEYPLSVGYQPDYRARNRNLRAELAGTFQTGPFVHELLLGASQNLRKQDSSATVQAQCLYSATDRSLVGSTFATTAVAGTVRSICKQNITSPHDIPQLGEPLPTYTSTEINDIGYYVFDRVKFGEWLQVLGGARKSDYTEKNTTLGTTTFKAKPWSFSYGAVVKPREWVSVYGTYIEGLEATPGAPTTAVNAGAQLPATESKQHEAGIKIQPRKGLLLQTAYFNIERASTYVNGANVYVQDGKARYKGVEISLTGDITRLLSIYTSAVFLNAKQVSGAPSSTSASGVFSPTVVGRLIDNTPKRTFSLSGNYRLTAFGLDGASLNGGVFYTGRRAVNALNQAFVPGYTLINIGAGYELDVANHPVTFRVNAENITGKRYWVSTGSDLLAQGAPSTVKFALGTRF